jgi:uncharacterized protein
MISIRRVAASAMHGWVRVAVIRPFVMIGIWLSLIAVAVGGLSRVQIETSGESILDKESEPWAFYQRSIKTFGSDEVIVAAIASETPFDLGALRVIASASRVLEGTSGVRRVDSLSTLPIISVGEGGEIRLDPALDPNAVVSDEIRSDVMSRVVGDRIATGTVVSEDGRVVAVNIWPEAGIADSYDRLVERIRGVIGSPVGMVSGVPVFRTETNLRTRRELGIFVPLTIGVIVLVLSAAFQSARAVIVPLLVSGTSVCVLGGFMGWVGIPLSAPTMILPSVLLAIGCAYTMHLLVEVADQAGPVALERSILEVARPIALSGLTTTVGFASAAIVPIEAVQRVGVLGSIGTIVACAATIGLGGSIVSLWPGSGQRTSVLAWLRLRLTPYVLQKIQVHSATVVGLWAIVLGIGVVGARSLQVESDVVVWFPRGTEVRDAYEEIKARLSGISPLNVVIEARDGASVADPKVVTAIDGLSNYLSTLPEVGKALSVADPLRKLREGFSDDSESPLPSTRESIEQYLLLLEGTDRLGDVITSDRRASNILLRVDNNSSRHLLEVARKAERWWEGHGASGFEARTTGIMFEVARSEDAIALGQIQGLGLDILIIGSILVVALRSFRLALLALIPNALPIGLMFGFMGLVGIPLDLGTVFVSNLAVGIAVDETIHVVTAYGRMRAVGWGATDALRMAMEKVMPALLLTTVVIAAGFAVLAISDFRFTRNLGLLTAGVMLLCVASNSTLLPALLLRWASESEQAIPRGVDRA